MSEEHGFMAFTFCLQRPRATPHMVSRSFFHFLISSPSRNLLHSCNFHSKIKLFCFSTKLLDASLFSIEIKESTYKILIEGQNSTFFCIVGTKRIKAYKQLHKPHIKRLSKTLFFSFFFPFFFFTILCFFDRRQLEMINTWTLVY